MRPRFDLSAFLSIVLVACASACTVRDASPTSQAPDGATSDDSDATDVELPADLRGVWLDRWSTSMGYELAQSIYDFDTGVWFEGQRDPWDMAPRRGFGIALGQDGSFLWVREEDGGTGGCQSYAIDVSKGVATIVSDGTIQLRPAARRQRYHSTCDPSLDYDRDADTAAFEMSYARGATVDTGLPTLTLADESGSFVYFLSK